jgi:hypothetical protein
MKLVSKLKEIRRQVKDLRSSSSGKHLDYGGADIAKKTKKTTTTKAKRRRRRRSSLSERQILQTQLVFLHRSIVCV